MTHGATRQARATLALAIAVLTLTGCASQPGTPYTLDTTPLSFVDSAGPEIADHRGRFREILCAINEDHGRDFPDYRPCSEILHHFSDEPAVPGKAVNLGSSQSKLHVVVVGGLVSGCYFDLLRPFPLALRHLQSLGYEVSTIKVDGLSSSAHNGRQIREAVLDMGLDADERLILVGYSKGTPDILEGLVAYPELQRQVAAVISIAGSVNGSPLSVDAPEWMLSLLRYLPASECTAGDGGAIESLKPSVRRRFAATHKLPEAVRYYSIGTFAPIDQISTLLRGSYSKLSEIDPRNDGQMLFYDQIIPGGALLGFVRSDHLAVALPLLREHPSLAPDWLDRNEFPREILLEAAILHVEEQLSLVPDGIPEDQSASGP